MSVSSLINKNYADCLRCEENFIERKEGVPLLKLDANENQMGTSTAALGAMIKTAAQVNFHAGKMAAELKEKLAKSLSVAERNIVIDSGTDSLIQHLFDAFLTEGDEVAAASLQSDTFIQLIKQHGAGFVEVLLSDSGEQNLEALSAVVTDKTKFIFVTNPCNPTGTPIKPAAIQNFISSLPDHVILIIDETYLDYADPEKYISCTELINSEKLIVLHSFFGIYGLAGESIAYMVSSEDICRFAGSAIMPHSVSKVAIAGASAALEDTGFVRACREEVAKSRDYLRNELRSLRFRVCRSQANYVYAVLPETINADGLKEFLESKGIYLRYYQGALCITVGTGWQCEHVVNTIKEYLGLRK